MVTWQKIGLDKVAKVWSSGSRTHNTMKLLLALLAGLALAAYIIALADGPNLFDILNNY